MRITFHQSKTGGNYIETWLNEIRNEFKTLWNAL